MKGFQSAVGTASLQTRFERWGVLVGVIALSTNSEISDSQKLRENIDIALESAPHYWIYSTVILLISSNSINCCRNSSLWPGWAPEESMETN